CREIPGALMLKQFENQANPEAHYLTTGPEIWQQTDGRVDVYVAGVGTGGTLCGTARYLKEKNPEIKIVAVEPLLSPMLSRGKFCPHGLQGMGPDFVPPTFDASLCDEYIGVSDEEAMQMARVLACEEGLLVGISSGAVVAAALKLAQEKDFENKRMVLLLPDTGERYLSTALFSQADEDITTK
ncbi:MAG: pyridoxal-phosphate dependent enzyme, partial [Bacteroidales bacterium]|nr:pyridoxal-phosphate dependent enzyme [Bacteroidales bacterium]